MGVLFHFTLLISDCPTTLSFRDSPDFAGNPESRPICHQDEKNNNFDLSRYFQMNSYDTYARTLNRVYVAKFS